MKYLLISLLLLMSPLASGQFVVIVPLDSNIDVLDKQDINNIFMARTSRLPSGEKARPIELSDQLLRQQFYAQLTGKSTRQLSAYWTTLVFTGKGRPPESFMDKQALLDKLHTTPGAIAYLPFQEVTDHMKVVYRFPDAAP